MKHTFNRRTIDRAFRSTYFILEVDWSDESIRLLETSTPNKQRPHLEVWSPTSGRRGNVRASGLSKLSPALFDLLKALVEFHPRVDQYDLRFSLSDQPFETDITVVQFLKDHHNPGPRGPYTLYFGSTDMTAQNHPNGSLLHVHPGAAAAHAVEIGRSFGAPSVYRLRMMDRGELAPPPEHATEWAGNATVQSALEIGTVLLRGMVSQDAIEETWVMERGQWVKEHGDTPANRLSIEKGWSPCPQIGVLMFDDPTTALPPKIAEEIEQIAESLDVSQSVEEWLGKQFEGQTPRHRAAFLRVVYELVKQPAKIDLTNPQADYENTKRAWDIYKQRYGAQQRYAPAGSYAPDTYDPDGYGPDGYGPPAPQQYRGPLHSPSSSHLQRGPFCEPLAFQHSHEPARRIASPVAPPQHDRPYHQSTGRQLLAVFYPMDIDITPVLYMRSPAVIAPLIHATGIGFSTLDRYGNPLPIDLTESGIELPTIWSDQAVKIEAAVAGNPPPKDMAAEALAQGLAVYRDDSLQYLVFRADGKPFGRQTTPNYSQPLGGGGGVARQRWGADLE